MRLQPSYANIASTLALVVALSGTAYAAGRITGADVKNSSLTGRDVRNNSLTTKDVRGLTRRDFRAGALPVGPGPGARMEASGALTVPGGGADATFEMDTEAYDTGGMYSAPDDFITITRSGTYLVTGFIQYGGTSGQRQLRVMVDGTLRQVARDSGDDPIYTGEVVGMLRLSVGQRVTLGTFSNIAVEVSGFTGLNDAGLAVQWMAP